MNLDQKLIQVEELDDKENWSLYPIKDANSRLYSSIRNIGILHPPLVQETSESKYKIINGRKRLRIAQELNLGNIHCNVLNENTPFTQTLKIHLAEQQFSNPLSLVEQAYFLRLCRYHISENDLLKDFLPLLGYSPKPSIIDRLSTLLQLEEELQSLLHNQTIGEKTAMTFLELNSKDRLLLGNLFVELNMGKGKQHRLLLLCHELSRRHHTTVKQILSDAQIKTVLQHKEMSAPQKTARILKILQTQHNPELFKAEKEFHNRINKINLPKFCSLSHSPAFEKDEITLEIKCKDLESCEKTLEKIRHSILN